MILIRKKKFKLTLETLISSLQTKYLVLSFSNEGFINKEELENMLNPWGSVKVFSVEYKRYVGAQIGIYNQQGLKVGNVKNLHNQEFLYVARRF